MIRKLALALLIAACPALARAQNPPVIQGGQVTPGHSSVWITNGVIGDGGAPGGPIFTGSTTLNDFACVGATGTIIDCGLSATGTNNWTGQQNFNGGLTASTETISGAVTATGPVVDGTTAAARSLNVGSNFAAAQPSEFNVNDNQAPADSRYCYLGVNNPGATNGGFINASCGTDSNPVNWNAASLSVFAATFGATGAGNSYSGEWHKYTISSGVGGFTQGLLIQTTNNGSWTPVAGITGNGALNAYANTTVGGFTFGATPAAAASGVTAANVTGVEVDTQYAAGAGGSKTGLQIADQLNNATGTSTVAASNTAFQILRVHNAYGWDTGILFPAGDGTTVDYPIRTTGTLIKSAAGTFAHGIDFSAGTCSTDCFKSTGFTIDGSGDITTKTVAETSALFTINQNATAAPVATNIPTSGVNLFGVDNGTAGFAATNFGQSPTNVFIRANGTNAMPTKLVNTNVLGAMNARGYDNSGVFSGNQARIAFLAAEDWNDATHRGTNMTFLTTPTASGTLTQGMELFASGGLGVGVGVADPGIGALAVTGNIILGTAAKTLVLKQGANGAVGTFICTSGGSITVTNSDVAVTDTIIISLNTAGGSISTAPALNAITASTSFVAKCATSDTSTYNYAIIKNAA